LPFFHHYSGRGNGPFFPSFPKSRMGRQPPPWWLKPHTPPSKFVSIMDLPPCFLHRAVSNSFFFSPSTKKNGYLPPFRDLSGGQGFLFFHTAETFRWSPSFFYDGKNRLQVPPFFWTTRKWIDGPSLFFSFARGGR